MGSDSKGKVSSRSQTSLLKVVAVILVGSAILYNFTDTDTFQLSKETFQLSKGPLELSRFKSCPPNKINHPPAKWTTKPLWFPGHPDSVYPSGAARQMINGITELPSGDKSFYALSGSQKYCLGGDETATCTVMGWDLKGGMEEKFNGSYLMMLRNPQTVFPAHGNSKDIAYHGGEGQLAIEKWRQLRDDWFDKMLDDWFNVLALWRDSSYKLGTYVVFEHLMDPSKGPKELMKVREVLGGAGFKVAGEENLECIWYNAIGNDALEKYHKDGYEYFEDYKPAFTEEQKTKMVERLGDAMQEYKDDTDLVDILDEYRNDILANDLVDEKFES